MTNSAVQKEEISVDQCRSVVHAMIGLAALGMFAGVRLLTEVTPKEIYGTAALLIGVAALMTQILGTPIFRGLARFYPEAAAQNNLAALRHTQKRIMQGATIFTFLIFGIAGLIFSRRTGIAIGTWLALALFVIASIALTAEKNFFAAARRQQGAVSIDVLRFWLQPVFALLAVTIFGATAGNIISGQAVGATFVCAIFAFSSIHLEGKGATNSHKPARSYGREIMRYSAPLVMVIPFLWINNFGDRYIAGQILGMKAVGLYAACYGLIAQPFVVSGGAIMQFLRPPYFNAVAAGDNAQKRRIFLGWLGLTLLIYGCGFLGVVLLKEYIAALFLASEYRDAAQLMPWIALGAALQGLTRILENVFLAMRQTKWVLLTQALGAATCVAAVYWLTAKNGILGTAQACSVYFGMTFAVSLGIILFINRPISHARSKYQ
ncbi:MAG: lipopolysaccharide biosynthesis protein [Lentisphaeria bacterium]